MSLLIFVQKVESFYYITIPTLTTNLHAHCNGLNLLYYYQVFGGSQLKIFQVRTNTEMWNTLKEHVQNILHLI